MPLVRLPNPSPSKTPYALKTDTFRLAQSTVWSEINAIWLGRKNRQTTVSFGNISLFLSHGLNARTANLSLEDTLRAYDGRHGGENYARWNGTNLWVNPREPLTLAEQAEMVAFLDPILTQVEAGDYTLPPGYQGWYLNQPI